MGPNAHPCAGIVNVPLKSAFTDVSGRRPDRGAEEEAGGGQDGAQAAAGCL